MLDRIIRIEPLRSAKGFEDGTDTPAQVLSAPACHHWPGADPPLTEKNVGSADFWALVEESSRFAVCKLGP